MEFSNFFAFFRLFDATWRPNTQTNIPESLHLDRSHVTLQICNSLCKWIMNSKDARWNFLIFCLFQTIWRHLAAKYTPIFLKLCTLLDIMRCYNFTIHYVSELWTEKMLVWVFFDFHCFLHFLTIRRPLVAKCDTRNPWNFAHSWIPWPSTSL